MTIGQWELYGQPHLHDKKGVVRHTIYLCFGPNLQTGLEVGITAFSPKEVEHKVEPKTLCNQNPDSKHDSEDLPMQRT